MSKTITIDRRNTFFNNEFLEDYYHSSKLDRFKSFKSIDDIDLVIAEKQSFDKNKREDLSESLKNQYAESEIREAISSHNIELLREDNTYTITTGQQIHIGLGPLYVLYKAYDVIAIANELSEKYPDLNFVPLFWMATEDHDLEEIAEVNVFGNKLVWNTDQKGAVGRMNPTGLPELFREIKEGFNFNEEQVAFIDKCIEVYSNSKTLTIAFRRLMHFYLGHTGLIILDADKPEFKSQFKPVFSDEINHANYEALEQDSKELESLGHTRQLHIRKNNLFSLKNGEREKVISEEITDVGTYVNSEYADLSPNAALRPLFQEWILPNLVYVGGGSEIKYWSQLKGLFKQYGLSMPLLHLRSSKILAPSKLSKALSSEQVLEMFSSIEVLRDKYAADISKQHDVLNIEFDNILEALSAYANGVKNTIPGFNIDAKANKLSPKLEELKALVDVAMAKKSEQNSDFNKVLKTRTKYFNSDMVQERIEHAIAQSSMLGWDIDFIHSHFGFKKSQKVEVIFA